MKTFDYKSLKDSFKMAHIFLLLVPENNMEPTFVSIRTFISM